MPQLELDQGGVCDHGEFEGIKFASIWSWIFDYSHNEMFLTPGIPCQNDYKKL